MLSHKHWAPRREDVESRHSEPPHLVLSLWNCGISQHFLPFQFSSFLLESPTCFAFSNPLPLIDVLLFLLQLHRVLDFHLGEFGKKHNFLWKGSSEWKGSWAHPAHPGPHSPRGPLSREILLITSLAFKMRMVARRKCYHQNQSSGWNSFRYLDWKLLPPSWLLISVGLDLSILFDRGHFSPNVRLPFLLVCLGEGRPSTVALQASVALRTASFGALGQGKQVQTMDTPKHNAPGSCTN